METIVSQKMSRGQGNELLNKLEAAGFCDELAQKVIESKGNDLAAKVVRQMILGVFEPSSSHKQARAVMGMNFFGVEEAIWHFGVNPSKRQLAYLAEVPFTKEVLKSCKDTHVLVAVFPMSLIDIRGQVEPELIHLHDEARCDKQAYVKDKGKIGWRLVRKVSIADSTDRTWNEQQALLSQDEETPKAQVVVYTIIGHFLQTGKHLFENPNVRTSSRGSDGNRVSVGKYGAGGPHVNVCSDDDHDHLLGLSAVRKS